MRIVCKNSNLVFQDSGNIKRVVFDNYDFDPSISSLVKTQDFTAGKYMLEIKSNEPNTGSFYFNTGGASKYFFSTKLAGDTVIFFEVHEVCSINMICQDRTVKATMSLYEVREIDYSDCYIRDITVNSTMLFDKTKTYKLEVVLKYTGSTSFKIYGWEDASMSSQIVKEVNAVDGDKLEYTFTGFEKLGLRSQLDYAHIIYKVTEIV